MAWADGELSEKRRRSLLEKGWKPDGDPEVLALRTLGDRLREGDPAPRLTNSEFFNRQVHDRIAADREGRFGAEPAEGSGSKAGARGGRNQTGLFELPTLAWAGAAALALSALWYGAMVHSEIGDRDQTARHGTQTTVIAAVPGRPNGIYVTPLAPDASPLTVVWTNGLQYLPDHTIR